MKKIKTRGNKFGFRRGQAVVEFAIVFPLFILLMAGIFEIGLYFWTYQVVQNASREGARQGTVLPNLVANDPRVIDRVELVLPETGVLTGLSATSTVPDCEGDRQILVTVTGTYNFIFLKLIGINNIDIDIPTMMRYEGC